MIFVGPPSNESWPFEVLEKLTFSHMFLDKLKKFKKHSI